MVVSSHYCLGSLLFILWLFFFNIGPLEIPTTEIVVSLILVPNAPENKKIIFIQGCYFIPTYLALYFCIAKDSHVPYGEFFVLCSIVPNLVDANNYK